MTRYAQHMRGRAKLAIIAIAALPTLVHAKQNFDVDIKKTGTAVVLEQTEPGYPGNRVRRGQEGWVRMSYVVTPDGRAIDPIILDSSGGGGFEVEAHRILPEWRFEPGDTELPYNIVNIRSEIDRGRDAATSKFIRRTRRILTHLHNEEVEQARRQTDAAYNIGGWNLFESTMLWLVMGRVDGVEENNAGKLEYYSRALEMGNSAVIPRDDRIDLLEKIFLLQSHFQQYAAALATRERLEKTSGSEAAMERTAEPAAKMQLEITGDKVTAAQATIFNPCDCDEGEPLWHYVPARRIFSFANMNGDVERFEARCEGQRISGTVEPGKSWTLAPEWGFCRVVVFGNDGATFDFLEHPQDSEVTAAMHATVAGNHVLDISN